MINLKNKVVMVTGCNSLTGIPLCKQLEDLGTHVLKVTHEMCDLTLEQPDFDWNEKPQYLFHLAGQNGGIEYNKTNPADIFNQTMKMALNVFNYAVSMGIKKVVTPLTSCGYAETGQPLLESCYLLGTPHTSVESHGYCRRAMLVYGKQLNKQFGNRFVFPIFNNTYGENDRWGQPSRMKVCGSLIKRFVDADADNVDKLTLWGDGSARRELLYSGDFAYGLISTMREYQDYEEPVNIGSGEDVSIKELALEISRQVGYKGKIEWDISKPAGAKSKLLSVGKWQDMQTYRVNTPLWAGLMFSIKGYRQFRENQIKGQNEQDLLYRI